MNVRRFDDIGIRDVVDYGGHAGQDVGRQIPIRERIVSFLESKASGSGS